MCARVLSGEITDKGYRKQEEVMEHIAKSFLLTTDHSFLTSPAAPRRDCLNVLDVAVGAERGFL